MSSSLVSIARLLLNDIFDGLLLNGHSLPSFSLTSTGKLEVAGLCGVLMGHD